VIGEPRLDKQGNPLPGWKWKEIRPNLLRLMEADNGEEYETWRGGRFAKLKGKLAKRGAKSPGALAAWIGRKKYGNKKMAKWSAKGRKRSKK